MPDPWANTADRLAGSSALIVGVGNIGSSLAMQLARVGVGRLKLLDRDTVEAKNVVNQEFTPAEIGRPKATALAERLSRQFPALQMEAFAADLEDVPLGEFCVDVLLGGLDSRHARQVLVSEIGWPLGIPVIDGGVGEGLLGRVQTFLPADDTACLECGWGPADYRALTAEYPCMPGAAVESPSTISPAFLGTVTAGLMTTEAIRRLVCEGPGESRELAFDLRNQRFSTCRLRKNPTCRFDHQTPARSMRLSIQADRDTAADLAAALQRVLPGVELLMFRRGLFSETRYAALADVAARGNEPLSAIGLQAQDRIAARWKGQTVWLSP